MSRTTQDTQNRPTGDANSGTSWLSGAGLVAAAVAFVGASCCVLPLILAMLGVSGAWIGQLEVFVRYQTYLAVVAIALVVAGWVFAIAQKSNSRTFAVLSIATILIAIAFIVPLYERDITWYLLDLKRS